MRLHECLLNGSDDEVARSAFLSWTRVSLVVLPIMEPLCPLNIFNNYYIQFYIYSSFSFECGISIAIDWYLEEDFVLEARVFLSSPSVPFSRYSLPNKPFC